MTAGAVACYAGPAAPTVSHQGRRSIRNGFNEVLADIHRLDEPRFFPDHHTDQDDNHDEERDLNILVRHLRLFGHRILYIKEPDRLIVTPDAIEIVPLSLPVARPSLG